MKIAGCETHAVRVTYEGSVSGLHVVLRLRTDAGIDGVSYVSRVSPQTIKPLVLLIEGNVGQLSGADPLNAEALYARLFRSVNPLLGAPAGLEARAASAVEAALWDIRGKALGQPLWRLWGGYRSSLPMIAIGGYYDENADLAAEVAELKELGLAGLKLKVGGLEPEQDAARARLAREAGGAGFVLAADANQGWTPEQAVRFARLVDDCDLVWFEEPCRWTNDRRAMRDVRFATGTRICAGQSEYSAAGCRDLMVEGAIDVCNFDASWSGGPTEWRRVASMALAFDVKMAHHEEPQVASHLLASIPHGTFVECFHPDRDPIWWNLISNRPRLVDGLLELAGAPGLGWELDADFLEAHRVTAA